MGAIRNGRVPVMLDRERHLLFSLDALEQFQEASGGFNKLQEFLYKTDKAGNVNIIVIKNLKWLLALLINEGAEDGEEAVTEKQVGKLVHGQNLMEVTRAIRAAFNMGMTGTKKAEDADDSEDGGNETGDYEDESGNYENTDDEKTRQAGKSTRFCPLAVYRRYAAGLPGAGVLEADVLQADGAV